MTYSKYLGNLIPIQFASWKFENKLQIADSIFIDVILDSYFLSENNQLISQVDSFVEQVFSEQWEVDFERFTTYLYHQLILKKGYAFDKQKYIYTTPVEGISPQQLWDCLDVEIIVLLDEDVEEWSIKFDVSGFDTHLSVLFTVDGNWVSRDSNDSRTPIKTEYKSLDLDLEFYFSEDVYEWVSTRFISSLVWGIRRGCRISIQEELFAIEGMEARIINCIKKYEQKNKNEIYVAVMSALEESFNVAWQDYNEEYEKDFVLEIANENRVLLWQLVAPPNSVRIVLNANEQLVFIHYNDCYWEAEHGIHFIYNEQLDFLRIGFGSDYWEEE
ncbi:DUF6985 domain-containing protein [Myroides odoratimimus]|uniref:DUF6985 domain-containing protein n=1 Tax=Myroides odoratimimus TaxID=76832 RepID=UPI002574A288|nr:hypothetical protein [Myroides odoratimimus]MDM1452587.1 hypothetical protein [Myroides odoratimimus]MDM1476312.1 hypothetical protein [Myroides odoratimimus]MDM1488839.1 hypothetical protein [Myroides odoratimimus]